MKLHQEHSQALRLLFGQLNITNKAESLKLYSAIRVIAEEFQDVIRNNSSDFPSGGIYIMEKVGLFASSVKSAAMPAENSSNTPEEWYKKANQYLADVENAI